MNIGVNVRLLIQNRIDGISRFTHETLKRITLAHPEHRFTFYFDRRFAPEFIFNSNITPVVVPPPTRRPFLMNIWTDYTLPFAMRNRNHDLLLSMDGTLPLSTSIPCLPVIHDLNYEHHPEWLPGYVVKYYKSRYPRFAAKGKRIATVSEFSRADISRLFHIDPSRIDVVYNGVSDVFKQATAAEIGETRKQHAGGKPYFLFVGSVHPRKNLVQTLRAFEQYKQSGSSDKVLIIAGERYFGNSELESLFESMQYKHDVYFTGSVTDQTLIRLYGAAHAFVYASLFEGFGIPLIEAMKSGIPVISSNTTAMPEVCSDAGLMVDPGSPEQIAAAMRKLDQEEVRNKLIKLGLERAAYFTWDRTAALLWKSIELTNQT